MPDIFAHLPDWARSTLIAAAIAVLTLAIHKALLILATRAAARTRIVSDDIVIRRLAQPTRWLAVVLALGAAQPAIDLPVWGSHLWQQVTGLLTPGLLGWLALSVIGAVHDILVAKSNIDVEDNLRARRRRTRVGILYRIAMFLILLVTFCLMLMSIPSIRSIGVTLMASAGLAALAVGAAAQPALKNIIAGLQMVFTEPIRIDDVVIMDGEWGRIEDIHLTFVVVRIWDERRLIVPISKFLEESFQNWTREASQLLGSVFWYLDPTADIVRLRAKLEEVVKANPRWDGRFCNLQVTDTKPDGIMEVRALMTAKDASIAFDLRCDVREAIFAFLRDEMPEALPRTRARFEEPAQPQRAPRLFAARTA